MKSVPAKIYNDVDAHRIAVVEDTHLEGRLVVGFGISSAG